MIFEVHNTESRNTQFPLLLMGGATRMTPSPLTNSMGMLRFVVR